MNQTRQPETGESLRKTGNLGVRGLLVGLVLLNAVLLVDLTRRNGEPDSLRLPPSQTAWLAPKPQAWPYCMPPEVPHSGKSLRIMCLGDSITFGNGNETLAFGGYREPLRRMIHRPVIYVGQQRCGYPVVAPNEGYPGWSLGELNQIAQQAARIDSPDIVLFMAGVNDFNPYHRESVDTALLYESRCIENISAGAPSALILVATLTPIRTNPYIPVDEAAALSARIPPLVEQLHAEGLNCRVVDMSGKVHLLPSEYDAIHVHPSDSGCVKEARVWAAAINYYTGVSERGS